MPPMFRALLLALAGALLVAVPSFRAVAQDVDLETLPEVSVNTPIALGGWNWVELGALTVTDGQRVQFEVLTGDAEYFELYNQYDRVVFSQRYGPWPSVRLMDGTYRVRVLARGTATATLWSFDDAEGNATVDTPVGGTMAVPGAEHRYALTSPGGRFTVLTDGAPWRLENAVDVVVRDGAPGAFDLQPGSYTLVVGGSGFSGAYTATFGTARSAVALALATPVADTVVPGDSHAFTYTATAGEQIQISGQPVGARLTVVDPHGAGVVDDTSGGPVLLTLGAGEHALELVNEGTTDLAYTLSVDPVSFPTGGPLLDDGGALTLGVPIVADIVAPSPGHRLTFDVTDPITAVFTVESTDPWILRDPVGQERPVTGPVNLGPGTWTVELVPTVDPSPYSVLVQQVVEEPLVIGVPGLASLAAEVAELAYTFSLPVDARVSFMPVAVSHTLDWRLEDEDGVTWFDAGIVGVVGEGVSLPAGAYRLVVSRAALTDPSAIASSDFETGFAEIFDEPLQLGDEVQGVFFEPHGLGTYRLEVTEDGTPFQMSVIQTFSYGGGIASDYTTPVPWSLIEPHGLVIRPMADQGSGTHSEIWMLDAGTYTIEVKPRQDRWSKAWLDTEWDLKPRGVATATGELWFGHDDNLFLAGPPYGISKVSTAFDGAGSLQLGAVETMWPTNWMWTWLWAPDGDAVYSQEVLNRLVKVDIDEGRVEYDQYIGVRAGLQPDASGLKVWIPSGSTVGEVSLYPFGTLIWHTVSGDDPVGGWTTDGQGRHWYTSTTAFSGAIVETHYGLVDLDTFQTTRQFTVLGGGGIAYDAFSDTLIVSARDELHQYDPDTLALVSVLDLDPGDVLDDRLVAFFGPVFDGDGRLYLLSGIGRGLITVVDYAASGLIGVPTNTIELQHLDRQPISIAPLVGPGSLCYAPPGITDFDPAPGSHLLAGSQILLTGTAEMRDITRPIEEVVVNGVPAAVDASGRFFAPITVIEGPQTIHVELYDRCGHIDQTLEIVGTDDAGEVPLAYTDVTHELSTAFTDTTWNTETRVLEVDVVGTNVGADALRGPLRLVVGPDDERVELVQADDLGSDGRPAVTLLAAGQLLEPGASLPATRLTFENPGQISLRADARWEYAGNQAPWFTTAPILEVVAGQTWAYDADAADTEGDPLTFSLEQSPPGMSIDALSGLMTWTPHELDAGLHAVTVAVSDALGGVGRQTFSVYVRLGDQNQPPIFTSVPPVHLEPSTSLVYDPSAVDVEGDPLTFALLDGPVDATIDPATGTLTWAGSSVDGNFPFTISVNDGRGGEASQAFVVTVSAGGAVLSTAPLITSFPPLQVSVGALYAYVPTAEDADGDVLTWWLVEAPDGMGIDTTNGRLLWTPDLDDVGAWATELAVTDGVSTTTQRWEIAVAEAPPNFSPVFTSAPLLSAAVGQLYTYDANADDPEGAELTFELFSGPAGATIDAITGLVQWTPSAVGEFAFVAKATDPGGAAALQAWVVRVRASNGAPVVYVDSEALIPEDYPWALQATAVDPEGDAVTFSLEGSGRYSFDIDPVTGLITYASSWPGSYLFDVVATDALGARGSAPIAVTVVADNDPPVVDIQLGGPACEGETTQVCVVAWDELKTLRYVALTKDGVNVPLDEIRCANVTWGAAGVPVTLVGSAQENSGWWGGLTGTDTLEVIPEAGCVVEPPPPDITVVSPVDGERLGVPADVVVTSTLAIDTWRYLLDGVVLAEGTGALPPTLGTFDPTLRENGLYTLTFEITDTAGALHSLDSTALVDGAMKLGTYDLAFTDASWTTSITSTSLVRSYSTLRKDTVGDFGHGWELSVADMTIATNGPLGDGGWSQDGCGFGLLFVPVCFSTSKPHIAVVTWPDGRVEAFDFTPEETSTFMPLIGAAGFTGRPGTTSTLRPATHTTFTISNGDLYNDLTLGGFYDPQLYVLTDASGVEYLLDKQQGLLQITDRSGNRTVYTDDGITPDIGIGVTWTRDALGRISQIQLADGTTLDYAYDAAGDLVTVTDQAGDVVEFVYDAEHRLVSYNDAGHPAAAVLTYDADGRLISATDPTGVLVTTSSDTVAWSETTVGPDPSVTTTTYFNADGLVERVVEDVAGVVREASWTYTADYLVATATAPSGAVTTYGYDEALRPTSVVDADGVLTELEYGAFDDVTELRVAGAVVGRWVYDADGHLLQELSPSGALRKTMTYDAHGILQTFADADGVGGQVLLDADFNVTGLTVGPTAAPTTVTATRDGLGRLISMTGAGATSSVTYDGRGAQTSLTDPNGHTQSWEYDDRGLVTRAIDKAGRATVYTWDDAARPVQVVDRNGAVITYTYDALGRLELIDGGDAWVRFGYDVTGQLVSVENSEQVLGFSWGVDGEIVTASSGPVVIGAYPDVTHTYTWSAGGRLERVDSPHGSVSYTYDALGRPVSQDDTLTGATTYAWGDDGRLTQIGRASGLTTDFAYTSGDRLERTTTTDGVSTLQDDLIEWDLRGQIGAVTDVWGRHDYLYDENGQLISADHPSGSGIADESYVYDALGNRIEWAGHPATEVVYDAEDRLLQDAEFVYTYDNEGRLLSKEDRSSGHTWAYAWDSFGQLKTIVHPDGSTTTFAYDGLGRRVQVVDKGAVTRFAWDGDELRMVFDGANMLQRWQSTDLYGELLAEYDAISGLTDDKLRNHLGSVFDEPRDSFGNPVADPTDFAPHALTWHTQDPTGLIYARARYLDPKTGRFLSQDPILSGNRYAYAANNPITMWDPYGLVAATEDSKLRSAIGLAIREAAEEIGETLACMFMTDAAIVALGGRGELVAVVACSAVGSKPKPRKPKGPKKPNEPDVPDCPKRSQQSFEGDTLVPTTVGPMPIAEVALHDRVLAQGHDTGDWEPVSETCWEANWRAPRTLGDGEVLVYSARNGEWHVAPRSSLIASDTWVSDGRLFRDGVDLGPAAPEDFREADATYVADEAHRSPCATDWVLVLGEGPVWHARLDEVEPGSTIAFQGRLLELGEGEVRATGEVLARVVDTFSRLTDQVIEAEIAYPDGRTGVITATPEHPFYLTEARKYVSLRLLHVGAVLRTQGGSYARLLGKSPREGSIVVFNLEVDGNHNYFAMAPERRIGVLTHNEPYEPPGPCGLRVHCKSRKEAYERAKRRGGGREPVLHPDHGNGHGAHYHPDVPHPDYDYDPSRPPQGASPHDHFYFPCR